MKLLLLIVAFFLLFNPGSEKLPEKEVPRNFGINIKDESSSIEDIKSISKLGAGFIRKGVYWDRVEQKKGVYDFSWYELTASPVYISLKEDPTPGISNKSPYPQSTMIKGLDWDSKVHKIKGSSGDNWPTTWVSDSLQITSYGDGDGFDGEFPDLSLGFSYIYGDPPNHRGKDITSNIDTPEGEGSAGIKSSGLIMVDSKLYLFVRNYKPQGSDDYTNSRLAWSEDMGKTFKWADWHFENTFGCPDFVQFGPNYSDAMGEYVYVASQDNDNAYKYSPGIVLAKVHKDSIRYRKAYMFYAGSDMDGRPSWSENIKRREHIFYNPAGTQRVSMAYNPALDRFILASSHQPEADNRTHTDALGIFESKHPWGPWSTVYYDDDWSDNCRTYHHRFPVKWMSKDGNEMWLLFSGLDCGYYGFCLQKAYVRRK